MARTAKNPDIEKPIKKNVETPLSKQFNQIKARYPGALLLFRVGDFYETFGDDAVRTSKITGITLTRRNNGNADDHLAGFPHHSLENYLPKLVRAGERVAICDQLEDPATAKGIVKRGVTELVTPGVSYNDNVLDFKKNNYLAAVQFSPLNTDLIGVSFLDISTGEFLCTQGKVAYVDKLLQSFSPSEVLICKKNRKDFIKEFGEKFNTFTIDDWAFTHDFAYPLLTSHFKTNSLKGFGVETLGEGIIASGVILHYLAETEHNNISHINSINRLEEDKYVWLDRFTIRNLELVSPQQEGSVPLIDILDSTITPMGARLLRKWMVLPLKEKNKIEDRLKYVGLFKEKDELREGLISHLKPVGDLERLISKVAVRRINPREMNQLKRALSQTKPIKSLFQTPNKYVDLLNDCEVLLTKIENTLKEDLPIVANQGNMIKPGVEAALDELHQIAFTGKDFLLQLQNKEIERTGINSLKISFNKVFGYYLEVTNSHKDRVPNDWIRKQTLVNAERYITEELKKYEETILTAEDKINAIEYRIFNELIDETSEYVQQIQQNARIIAEIDALVSFAKVAIKNNYVLPIINNGNALKIVSGRHPVIEQQLPLGESYVPNDLDMDDIDQQIIVITGPNMAGKSALLRQTALIVLMAQIGSFVPASSANIGIVDKIFTRVGASDNLSKGESTFMVEMTETASILNNLSAKSLILMDEIGRGTSTYDGVSIAWSIAEFLHNHAQFRPKTLFATHYHELNELAKDFNRIKNYNVSVKEVDHKIIFLRKLTKGGSEHSFGIHVAKLAGMPLSIVMRSNEILQELEKNKSKEKQRKTIADMPKQNYQLSMFDAAIDPALVKMSEKLRKLDVNTLSPIEALLKLNELKKDLESMK